MGLMFPYGVINYMGFMKRFSNKGVIIIIRHNVIKIKSLIKNIGGI
jgi:hypothetical protein